MGKSVGRLGKKKEVNLSLLPFFTKYVDSSTKVTISPPRKALDIKPP